MKTSFEYRYYSVFMIKVTLIHIILYTISFYICFGSSKERSPYLPTRTDKSHQEPTRAIKCRQEAFLCIFRLKYYLLDHIYGYISKLATLLLLQPPKTMNLQHSKLPYLPTRSFVRLSWRYMLAVTRTLVLYQKLHRSESITSFAIT